MEIASGDSHGTRADGNPLPPSTAPAPAQAAGARPGNGVNRCPQCGASKASFDGSWLICSYCKHRWNTAVISQELRLSEGIDQLKGTTALSGAGEVDAGVLVTVQCNGCGACITLNTDTALSATCHWCRHTLSLNTPVANGAVPDAILPFAITRDDASARMAAYVRDHETYASEAFMADFAKRSIHAVYLPYLVIDAKVTVRLDGEGWVRLRQWSSTDDGPADHFETDVHAVTREVDLLIDDLAIEARATRSRLAAAVSTTNIINAIQPFDVANAVRFNAHYLAQGTAFERRDIDIAAAMPMAADLFATTVRGYVQQTLGLFTGGVRWDVEQASVHGSRWVSVLLPVWLYGFQEQTEQGPMMHYIAVNGRSGEVEGSVAADTKAITKSAKRWGRTVAWIIWALFGGPALLPLAMLIFGSRSFDTVALALGIAAVFAVTTGGIGIVLGKFVSKWRSTMLANRQRNPDARLRPETETAYTPTRMNASSTYLGTFEHGVSAMVPDQNDHTPQVRAKTFRYTMGGPVADPYAGVSLISKFGAEHPGARRQAHAEDLAQPPHGKGPQVDLAGGWRMEIPWLKRR